jgi:uncharacterized repeat protein (TIGR03803 family)
MKLVEGTMKNLNRHSLFAVVLLLSLTTVASRPVHAQTFTVLYTFGAVLEDAANSMAGVIRDLAGNLYGTTNGGGALAQGTVFELAPVAGGGWTETILHSFAGGAADGADPRAGLIRDSKGNFYGTTIYGGAFNQGTVFKLAPATGGSWTETILYSFTGGTDGAYPFYGSLVLAGGYLYGTTYEGGDLSCLNVPGCGVVFRVKATGGHESVLHSFSYNPPSQNDGAYPFGGVSRDTAGNVYGVTYGGGSTGDGVVFKLSPATGGGWAETLLHTFSDTSPDGVGSYAGLVRDKAGNLYGTTSGENFIQGAVGTIFEVDSAGTETLPHIFTGPPSDGGGPMSNLILDGKGNLYGTTPGGGTYGAGAIFKLSPTSGGWTETILYSFTGGADGSSPLGTLLRDSAGNLYGTTYTGGVGAVSGVVFELTPK